MMQNRMPTTKSKLGVYIVNCVYAYMPNRVMSIRVTAPSKAWIKQNWRMITNNSDYYIRSITKIA